MATENKKNTNPKQMHYIPNFYLKYFANENHKIWVYDRVENKYWNQLTSKVARKNNYYVLNNENGTKNYSVDNFITDVENATKFILDKIKKSELVTINEKVTLSIFLASQVKSEECFESPLKEKASQLKEKASQFRLNRQKTKLKRRLSCIFSQIKINITEDFNQELNKTVSNSVSVSVKQLIEKQITEEFESHIQRKPYARLKEKK